MIDTLRVRARARRPRLAKRDARRQARARRKAGRERRGSTSSSERIDELQYRLFAEDRRSVLLVLQGLDASGKDGVVRARLRRRQPAGLQRRPRSRRRRAPSSSTTTSGASTPCCRPRGEIGIFNRSHYEDVVAVRMLELAPEEVWRRRSEHIVRVGADARRRGHDDREGVPQRLAGGAAAPASRSGSTTRRSAGSSGASDLEVRARFDD